MATCTKCGNDVTGKKFCADCGTPVATRVCPQCQGDVNPGAAFCMHCGSSLSAATPPPPPAMHSCPSCQTRVPAATAFCTNCGHNMHATVSSSGQSAPYTQYPSQPQYSQSQGQYSQPQGQYSQPQGQYGQPGYQQPQGQYSQPQYGQPGYQQYQQPMIGQSPMVLRCPTCMAMSPVGTAYCNGCRTSLAGVVPVPATMPGQQNGIGGFLQGNGGKVAMGVLGGAAAVIGGEMLLNGVENVIEDRVEGDMGYGRHHRHHHRHEDRDEGLLGGLGRLADDIGL